MENLVFHVNGDLEKHIHDRRNPIPIKEYGSACLSSNIAKTNPPRANYNENDTVGVTYWA
jgi:hypothetical protein